MNYDKLKPSGASHTPTNFALSEQPESMALAPPPPSSKRRRRVIFLSLFSAFLIVASAISAVVLVRQRIAESGRRSYGFPLKPTQAISRACSRTQYPALCVKSLLDFPGALTADVHHLVHISLNMTLQHLTKALYTSSQISSAPMDPLTRSAYEDCLELLDDAIDAFSRSLFSIAQPSSDVKQQSSGSTHDVLTWLSAALTYQDTCSEGFDHGNGPVKDQMAAKLNDLSQLMSNSLAIFAGFGGGTDDFSGVPVQNKRRLMESQWPPENADMGESFPKWVSGKDRHLLASPISSIQADIVVAKDGSGKYKTVAEAIAAAPSSSGRRTIIYVKAGR